MKSRKATQSTRRTAQGAGRRASARAQAKSEPQVSGLARDGEIRLAQLLRALTGEAPVSIKPAH